MSAIFGIIDLEGRPIEATWISSMQKDLAHRGPEGQRIYQETSMFFGHMLFQVTPESVYDTSPYEEDGFVITADARLDEREAIMNRLNTPKEQREIITDPLLLLRSFLKFGKDFVKDIYGDFAFAIWDIEKKELFCARDQMGVKPFLYYFEENRIVFSTELKSIVKLPFVDTTIDQIYMRDRSITLLDKTTQTTWKKISRLSPAKTIQFNKHVLNISQYWKPIYKRNLIYKTEQDSASALKVLIERAISDRIRTIGQVGITLSGGLDSSAIACIAAKKLESAGKNLFSVSSVVDAAMAENCEEDELEYIELVLNQHKNIKPSYVYHSDLSMQENIDTHFDRAYTTANDFHYIDVALYSRLKLKSVNRVLNGYLGDETVSNKSSYFMSHLFFSGKIIPYFKILVKFKRQSNSTYIKLLSHHIVFPILPKFILRFIYRLYGRKTSKYELNFNKLPIICNKDEINKLKKRDLNHDKRQFISNISPYIWNTDNEYFEEEWDCKSSYFNIEIAYPFADRRIIELLMQIPLEHYYAEGLPRGLLRHAMQEIMPEEIRLRKDKGYFSPGFYQIFRNDIATVIKKMDQLSIDNPLYSLLNKKIFIKELKKHSAQIKNTIFDNYIILDQTSVWIAFNFWYDKKLKTKEHESND
jgi:asparagine synthase (glutamine-hydrolysing)